jgi:hypothetical protein
MAEYPENIPEYQELADARSLAREWDSRILEFLEKKQKSGPRKDLPYQFKLILEAHKQNILKGVAMPTDEVASNFFHLVGAVKLARANTVSRLVSTHLGKAWEEMAALSHVAVSPDIEFGVRLTGVDIIFLENNILRHTQIKTQKNTLTGSQKPRSLNELRLHPKPLFAVAFDVANWTFSSKNIERAAGEAFWSKLSIRYEDVVGAARECLTSLERELF